MKKFNYKTTRNSLLNLFSFNVKEQHNYIHQFERVATNYDLNDREEFTQTFFQQTFCGQQSVELADATQPLYRAQAQLYR